MKTVYRLMMLLSAAVMTSGFIACEEDLGPSIFDTREYPLDRSVYTFPLDTFVKVNFLEPYNLRYIYRMEDVGSDKDKNLIPAGYEESKKLAVLSKYLWYDIYKQYAGELFLKENSPRIIHVIGSKSYNPTQGSETLGVAEGGIKISLYGVNGLNENDIDYMNKYFFHTMHHEFSHILDQTKLHPTSFNTISAGKYNAAGWTDIPDSVSCGNGFVTSYGSSSINEDLVEISSTYITADTLQWIDMLNSASYEWEYIDSEYDSESKMLEANFGNAKYQPSPAERDTVGYFKKAENGDNKIYRKACRRDVDGHVLFDEFVKKYKDAEALIRDKAIKVVLTEEEKNEIDNHECDFENCPHGAGQGDLTDEQKEAVLAEKLLAKIKSTIKEKISEKSAALVTVKETITDFSLDDDELAAIDSNAKQLLSTVTAKNYEKVYGQIATAYAEPLKANRDAIDSYVGKHIDWIHDLGQTGKDIILNKLDIVRTWLNDSFGFSIDDIRREVQQRQYVTDAEGNFVIQEVDGKRRLVNKLAQPQSDGRTFMQHLLDEIEQYKELQIKVE